MSDVAADPRPALAVIPDVELLHVGMNWPLMSDGVEDGTFTPEDLAAAVAAQDDPSVRSPVVKFGHSVKLNPFGDGAPVWGRATNLRLANDGMTLVGDLTGVPVWLAEVMPSAWPSRSVEGKRNATSDLGRQHGLILTAVSLLGVELPAISTLDEVRAVWSARTPEEANVTLQEDTMPSTAAGRKPAEIAASTTTEDIRRAYYESLPSGSWWWIRELELDPLTLIVDDDDGSLWRVPVDVSGESITFGTPTAVKVEYVAVAAGASTSAIRAASGVTVFASRAESRQGVALDPIALRKSLGLPETATDEEVLARGAELAARPDVAPDTTTEPGGADEGNPPATPPVGAGPAEATNPAGTVVVDAVQWAEVQRQAAEGALAASRMRDQERERFIGTVVAAGRLSRANIELRASLEREWDRDPVTAGKIAAGLAVVVPTAELGHGEGAEPEGDDPTWDAFERSMSPDVAATRAAQTRKA